MPGAFGVPDKAVGLANGVPGIPNGGAPGVPPVPEAAAAGVPLGEFALLDVDRRRRTGVPEVVYGEGKTSEQIFLLLAELRARDPEAPALATRCPADVLDRAATRFPGDAVHADHRRADQPGDHAGQGTVHPGHDHHALGGAQGV